MALRIAGEGFAPCSNILTGRLDVSPFPIATSRRSGSWCRMERWWRSGREHEARPFSATPEASRMVAGGPSVSERPPERDRARHPTAAAVAEEIHAAWYLIRDSIRSRFSIANDEPVVARFA